MFTKAKVHLILLLLVLLQASAWAQTRVVEAAQAQDPEINIIINQKAVKFAAPTELSEWRLEVMDQKGELIFDSGVVSGQALEWPLRNQRGDALESGLYAYSLTTKDTSGDAVRTQRGYVILERAGGSSDRVWVTSDTRLGIGAESRGSHVTVTGSSEATVGGAQMPATDERSVGTKREGIARQASDRAVETKEPEPAASRDKKDVNSAPTPAATTLVDDIQFSDAGVNNPRDIHLSNNIGGLRFYGTTAPLTVSPSGAAIQFWGNNSTAFPGQLYLDSGAHNNAALIFRTAVSGGIIGERMRVTADGKVGVGTISPSARLDTFANSLSIAIQGTTSTNGSIGVRGDAGGTNSIGVIGLGSGIGVRGYSSSGTGVNGESVSSHAMLGTTSGGGSVSGVYGSSSGANGNGVIGEANNGPSANGVWGKSANGRGVVGTSLSGNAIWAQSSGQARNAATLRADNVNSSQGMAAYLTNMSNFATAHFANSNNGEVLYLQANGGPFIRAVDHAESATLFSVNYDGTTVTKVLQITGGSDFSEQFEVNEAPAAGSPASASPIQPGLVVSIDPASPGKLIVSRQAYDRRVAGIISGAGGVKPGMMMGQAGSIADGSHPVALTGRVYCRADASNGSIEPGDLLTTASTPGHAMKVTDPAKAQGAIIGKAMTALKEGKGLVLVLVTLQ
jgi:hypothetical protein